MGDRILRIRIEKKDENLTVEQYLKKNLEFSKKQISRLKFREDGIRVDDVRQRVTKRLREGEYLEILLESCGKDALQLETDSGRQKLYILYEDADLLIVRKPSGLVCHPSHGHYQDTLANQAAAYGRERCASSAGWIRTLPASWCSQRMRRLRPFWPVRGKGGL